MTLNYSTLPKDNEGFLLDPGDWSSELAEQIAKSEEIEMSQDHWDVVHFVRSYYESNDTVPELRTTLKYLKQHVGDDKATRKHVYRLFPYGYGQQACKIAGMRKPLKLMLDL
tara:strand:- start:850 stop:1185 length:336 start_codon:yes stop_codon:yes gene_type:complete